MASEAPPARIAPTGAAVRAYDHGTSPPSGQARRTPRPKGPRGQHDASDVDARRRATRDLPSTRVELLAPPQSAGLAELSGALAILSGALAI